MILSKEGSWRIEATGMDYLPMRLLHKCPVRPRAEKRSYWHYYPGHPNWPNDHEGCTDCHHQIPSGLLAMYYVGMLGRHSDHS